MLLLPGILSRRDNLPCLYTCEKQQTRLDVCTSPAFAPAEIGRIANPQVHSQHLYMREMARSQIRRYDSPLAWQKESPNGLSTAYWDFCPSIVTKAMYL